MELDDALTALYAAAPAEFVTRRDAIVAELRLANRRALGDKVHALRKPSLAAWSLNLLARSRPDELDRLPQLGRDLRSAQSLLTGNLIRSLSADRHRLVTTIVKLASDAASERGHPLGPAAQQEVATTITAALVSEEATQAVTSGLLTRALTYAGFGDVDISGAIAQPTQATQSASPARERSAPPPTRTTRGPAAALAAEQDALVAADASVALAEEELERLQAQGRRWAPAWRNSNARWLRYETNNEPPKRRSLRRRLRFRRREPSCGTRRLRPDASTRAWRKAPRRS